MTNEGLGFTKTNDTSFLTRPKSSFAHAFGFVTRPVNLASFRLFLTMLDHSLQKSWYFSQVFR